MSPLKKLAVEPTSLFAAKDGSVWYTDSTQYLKHFNGQSEESYKIVSATGSRAVPFNVTEDSTGTIWFDFGGGVCNGAGYLSGGKTIAFADTSCGLAQPYGIAIGKNNRLYVAELNMREVHVFSKKGGLVDSYKLPKPKGLATQFITAGPDGNLWASDENYIARMSVYGKVTFFRIPGVSQGYMPRELAPGFDGSVWMLQEQYENASGTWITRITPDGKFAHYSIGPAMHDVFSAGPNESMWYITARTSATLGSVSMSGKKTLYEIAHSRGKHLLMLASSGKGPIWVVGSIAGTAHPYFLAQITP